MKILVITQKYDFNDSTLGAFIDWWDRLARKMEQVYILALEKHSESTLQNIEILSMGKECGAGLLRKIFNFYFGLFKIIGKSDAILVHMVPKYVILAAPVALIFRKPIYLWYTGVAVHWQLRLAVLFCKKVFTAHEAAMRINTKKRIITGHGIDTNKFQIPNSKSQMPDKITILSVGRITPSKGHELVIKSVAELVKAGYDLKLRIVGGVIQERHQEYADSLKKLVTELGIEDHVEFIGAISYERMPQFFNQARILINAVSFGGLDKVVLEAMAGGVLPLTSNSAFLNIFPKEFSNNLVFKPNNSADLEFKLKNILDGHLYQNEILRQELRNIIIKNHNLTNLVERIIKEMKQ